MNMEAGLTDFPIFFFISLWDNEQSGTSETSEASSTSGSKWISAECHRRIPVCYCTKKSCCCRSSDDRLNLMRLKNSSPLPRHLGPGFCMRVEHGEVGDNNRNRKGNRQDPHQGTERPYYHPQMSLRDLKLGTVRWVANNIFKLKLLPYLRSLW